MTRSSLKTLAGAGVAALVLAGASAPASAYYLGYGNGDPGNWDFWTEQNGGRAPTMAPVHTTHHAPMHRHTHYAAARHNVKHT